MIQLTRKGVVFSGSNADLRGLRARFARDHYIILPKLIEPELMETILRRIEAAPFEREEYNGIVSQSVMKDPNTFDILSFLLNAPAIHRLVERISGCRRIADFRGRVYRMLAARNDQITWHTDLFNHRLVALSLNLTPQYFRGGVLQIKYRGSDEILHEVHNTGLGDALLLRVARKLSHRVLPVEGDVPRTAMSGWFRWKKRISTTRYEKHPGRPQSFRPPEMRVSRRFRNARLDTSVIGQELRRHDVNESRSGGECDSTNA